LFLSVVLFWGLLAYVEKTLTEGWFSHAVLAIAYLAGLILVADLLLPRFWFQTLNRRVGRVVKLGLLCNYLTLPLVLHVLVGAWWQRAVSLAAVIGGSLLAVFVARLILPSTPPEQDATFDPSVYQGRHGRYD
jgi:hypothetical protein